MENQRLESIKQKYEPISCYEIEAIIRTADILNGEKLTMQTDNTKEINAAKEMAAMDIAVRFERNAKWRVSRIMEMCEPTMISNEDERVTAIKFYFVTELRCKEPKVLPGIREGAKCNLYGLTELEATMSHFLDFRPILHKSLKNLIDEEIVETRQEMDVEILRLGTTRKTSAEVHIDMQLGKFSVYAEYMACKAAYGDGNDPNLGSFMTTERAVRIEEEASYLIEDTLYEDAGCKLVSIRTFTPRIMYDSENKVVVRLGQVISVKHPKEDTLKDILKDLFGDDLKEYWGA